MNISIAHTSCWKQGFMLIESLIAISILLLVSPAFMQYVFTFDINRYISSISHAHIASLLPADRDMISGSGTQQIDTQSKNCDFFFSSILHDGTIDIDSMAIDTIPIKFEITSNDTAHLSEYAGTTSGVYSDAQLKQDMIESNMTAIESFGKTMYGQYTVYIGSNSASTSIPDLFVFSYDIDQHALVFKDRYYLGPGIVSMDLHPRLYGAHFYADQQEGEDLTNAVSSIAKYLGMIEKSIVTPLWIMRYRYQDILASSTPIIFSPHLNIAGAYPQAIKMYSNWFIIGTQKSLWSELVIGTLGPDSETAQIMDNFEIGTGVHDIALLGDRIIYASPKNPELDSFSLHPDIIEDIYKGSGVYSPRLSIHGFDAPGELGNGKSISIYPYGLFLGRTVGNHELYSLIQNSISRYVSASSTNQDATSIGPYNAYWNPISANPNISLRKLLYVHDGYGLIALTNSDTDAVKIYMQSKNRNTYQLRELVSLDLPAKPTDAICIQDQLVLTTESPTAPIVVIYEKSN